MAAPQDDGKRQLRLGWDVGGWHCDKGKSRDALVVLEVTGRKARRIGESYRGNVRETLLANSHIQLIKNILGLCKVEIEAPFDLTIAIDTPLAWPIAFQKLIAGSLPAVDRFNDSDNPFTRRKTEIQLIANGHARITRAGRPSKGTVRPLSPVRDQIGSQATKGMYFLSSVGFHINSLGVFQTEIDDCSLSALEAYPALAFAACNKVFDVCFRETRGKLEKHDDDIVDALSCAVVAHLWADRMKEIAENDSENNLTEGRIIYPKPSSMKRSTTAATT